MRINKEDLMSETRPERAPQSRAALDSLHHVAVQVQDLDRAVAWYQQGFNCEVTWHDESWALINFANASLALVSPGQHPPHIAFTVPHPERFGPLTPHRDGSRSIYIEDSEGNVVECLDPESLTPPDGA